MKFHNAFTDYFICCHPMIHLFYICTQPPRKKIKKLQMLEILKKSRKCWKHSVSQRVSVKRKAKVMFLVDDLLSELGK